MKHEKAHTRIIWGISWAHDDSMFATASREKGKAVKFWNGTNSNEMGKLCGDLPEKEIDNVTAISFFPRLVRNQYAMLTGVYTGQMNVWILSSEQKSWV
jgi:elongator complex protein 2